MSKCRKNVKLILTPQLEFRLPVTQVKVLSNYLNCSKLQIVNTFSDIRNSCCKYIKYLLQVKRLLQRSPF
jgi:hypothetical protein